MRRTYIFFACISIPTLTGCPAETDDRPPGCECIIDEDAENPPYDASAPTCGEELCAPVDGSCPSGDCYDETTLEANADALTCALTALRNRTPGVLRWTYQLSVSELEHGYLLIHDDGTAVRRDWGQYDLNIEASDAELGALPSAERFDACLAETTVAARFDCLRAPLESQLAVCDEGWQYDDF